MTENAIAKEYRLGEQFFLSAPRKRRPAYSLIFNYLRICEHYRKPVAASRFHLR